MLNARKLRKILEEIPDDTPIILSKDQGVKFFNRFFTADHVAFGTYLAGDIKLVAREVSTTPEEIIGAFNKTKDGRLPVVVLS